MKNDKALTRAARLVILLRLDNQGQLAGKSCRKVQAEYFPNEHHTTIYRDIRDLPKVREMVEMMNL